MSEHTQGPWSLQRNITNYRSGRKSLEVRGPSNELIATFPGCDRDKANARLMAAAPDLLEALKRVLPQYEALLKDSGLTSMSTVDQARAAIAKAENKHD